MVNDIVQEIVMRIRTVTDNSLNKLNTVTEEVSYNMKVLALRSKIVGRDMNLTSKAVRNLTMNKLGLLFAGISLSNMMNNLLGPAFEVAGVFDIISTILELMFLPLAIALIDPLLEILDWAANSSDEFKMFAGVIVLLISTVGTLLSMLAQFLLANPAIWAVIIEAFGGVLAFLGTLLAAISSSPSWLIAIVAVILASLLFNVEGFFDSLKKYAGDTWDSIGGIIDSASLFIQGIIKVLVGIIQGDFDLIGEGLKEMFEGILGVIINFMDVLVHNGVSFGFNLIKNISDGIKNGYSYFKEAIRGIPIIGNVLVDGGDLISGGLNVVSKISEIVSKAVSSISSNLAKGLNEFRIKIPGLAEGGIVNRPTLAMVGEAGPEAIIPLSGGASYSGGAGSTVYAPQVSLNAVISNELDIKDVAEQVNRYLVEDYKRVNFA